MRTKRMMVKSMFISIITAGVFCFGLTACSNRDNGDTPEPEPIGDYSEYESYGLTYPYFDHADDVKILNADTTEIAVKKSLADKLGIKTFINHPIGIWDAPTHLAYGRKALEERLDGDTYILKVTPATVAELIGDKITQLSTDIFINSDADAVNSFSALKGVSEFAAKYMEADGTIHPCMVHMTDRFGYKKGYHLEGEDQDPDQIMAHKLGEFQSMTPEEILQQRNASERVRIISLHNNIEFDYNIPIDDDSKDSINIAGEIPIDFDLDYFITIDPGIDWHWYGPELIIDKFETGLAGAFGFHPSVTVGFKKELKLDEDKGKIRLAKFNGFSFTFTVGVIPVTVEISPSLNLVFDASVSGAVQLGFHYNYANSFRAGIRYNYGRGWGLIKEFEEKENEFIFARPELSFSAEAGVGFFLTAAAKIYGVAGPELGIGPRLGAKADLLISPDGVDWSGEVNMTLQAWAGAKVEILGYELAEWSTRFDIAGPWQILKFPMD